MQCWDLGIFDQKEAEVSTLCPTGLRKLTGEGDKI